MQIKYSIKRHIKNNIWLYIAALVLVPIASDGFIKLKTQAKDVQKYQVFVSAPLADMKGLKKYINGILVDDLIIRTFYASQNDSSFGQVFSASGRLCDLIILSKTIAEQYKVTELLDLSSCDFLPLENAYEVEGKKIGVNLKHNDNFLLSSYINYLDSEEYYAFVNPDSVHTLGICEEGKTNQTETLLKEIFNV